MAGQILGLSVIANHARTLGLSLASEQFGADFFGDGAHPSGILTTDQPVSEDQAKTIKARFVAAIRGSREPAVLGAGVKYTQVQIAPHESQFIDTQKFTAAELCRLVGPGVAEMLGYETGGKLTYQNVQSRSLHLLIYTVDKWLKEFEDCLSQLFVPGPQQVEYDRAGLLRMTPGDRWDVYTSQLQTASRVINEVRADEDMAPVDWGDKPYLPAFGKTGTAAAEAEQIAALVAEGTPVAGSGAKTNTPGKGKVPAPPKIAGETSK
jgi:HK97 family phage portal protein